MPCHLLVPEEWLCISCGRACRRLRQGAGHASEAALGQGGGAAVGVARRLLCGSRGCSGAPVHMGRWCGLLLCCGSGSAAGADAGGARSDGVAGQSRSRQVLCCAGLRHACANYCQLAPDILCWLLCVVCGMRLFQPGAVVLCSVAAVGVTDCCVACTWPCRQVGSVGPRRHLQAHSGQGSEAAQAIGCAAGKYMPTSAGIMLLLGFERFCHLMGTRDSCLRKILCRGGGRTDTKLVVFMTALQ